MEIRSMLSQLHWSATVYKNKFVETDVVWSSEQFKCVPDVSQTVEHTNN